MRIPKSSVSVILVVSGLSCFFSSGVRCEQQDAQRAVGEMPRQSELAMAHDAFVHSRQCFYLNLTISMQASANEICDKEPLGTRQKRFCTAKEVSSRQANERRGAELTSISCTSDEGDSYASFVAAVGAAVVQGDPDAEICYISGRVNIKNSVDKESYIKAAEAMARRAFARGDWRVVKLYDATPHFARTSLGNPMVYLSGYGTDFSAYKSEKLMYLGSLGHFRGELKSSLSAIGKGLTGRQMADADAWASESYAKYFSGSPALSSAPTPCVPEPGSE